MIQVNNIFIMKGEFMNLTGRLGELKRFINMNQAHEFDTIVTILETIVDSKKNDGNGGDLSALLGLINDMLDRDKIVLRSRACTIVLTKLFVERVIEVLLQYIIEDKEGVEIYELHEFILSTGAQYRLYKFYVSSISSISDLDDTTQLVDVLMRCIELIKYMRLDNFFSGK